MSRARAISKAADRRLWLAAVVRVAGRCATLAAAGGLALLGADRLLSLHTPVWALFALPALGALGATVALSSRVRRRQGSAPVVVDHSLGLRDRVSSALAFEGDADPFASLAQREGEDAAAGVDLRRAVPLRFDSWWLGAPVAIGALVVGVILLPNRDLLGLEAQRLEEVAQRELRDDAARTIDDAAQRTREAIAQAAVDAATPEQLAALDEIERELAEGRIRPDEARAQAASRLDDLAQRYEDRAERDSLADDALAERFGSLDAQTRDSLAQSLEDALKRGDFDRAQQALEQLQRDLASDPSRSSDEARDRLAQDLDAITRALRDAARQRALDDASPPAPTPGEQTPPRNADAFDALREQSIPDDLARRLADETDQRALRESLEREGLSPQQADRLARQIAQDNLRRDAQEQASRDAQDLADALDNLARDIRDDAVPPPAPPAPPPPPPPPTPPGSQGSPSPPDPSQPRERTPGAQPQDNPSAPGERQADKDPGAQQRNQQDGPSRDIGADQGDERRQSTERGRQQTDAQRPDNQQPQPGAQDAPSSSKDDAASPSSQPAPPDSPQSQRDATGQGAAQERDERTATGPGADTDAQNRRDAAAQDAADREGDQSSQGQGVARALDKVREMQRRRQDIQQGRETAQRVREQSEQLLDSMSPEEREQARRLAELLAQEQGASRPFDAPSFEDVDARRPAGENADDAGRVIAEWLSQGQAQRGDPVGTVDAQRRLTDAARGAQRAIEEQQTPARYADVIRRYFRRLPDAATSAASSTGATPDAPDVPPRQPAP